jgi:hypothetical protein
MLTLQGRMVTMAATLLLPASPSAGGRARQRHRRARELFRLVRTYGALASRISAQALGNAPAARHLTVRMAAGGASAGGCSGRPPPREGC